MSDDFLFGLKFNFDPTDFLRGSAEAQDELERMVAGMAHARRRSEENVEGLARSLSLSTNEVRAALKDIERAERDHAKESTRISRDAERDRAQQEQIAARRRVERERAEMTSIRERTQAVAQLRDTLLSVAAITLGEKGVAGLNSLMQETSARGVEESNFAERTGTTVHQNVAEEEGALLSGRSNREEARQSIATYADNQAGYQTQAMDGAPMLKTLASRGVHLDPEILKMNHADFVQYVVKQLRGLGNNDHMAASILELSGLTSGGYTNLALHPDEMRRFNAKGAEYGRQIEANAARDLEFQQSWQDLMFHVNTFRTDISHDLEPMVKSLDGLVQEWDKLANNHPDAVRNITTVTAVAIALGGLFSAIAPIVGTLIGMRGLLKGAGLLKDGATLIGRGGAATVRGGAAVIADNPIVAAATVAGAAGYAAYKEISYDRSDAGRIANNLKAMRDPHYGANRYSALEKNQREYELTQYLMKSRGYTPEQAAAVAAMARSEGGFNTEAIGDSGYAEGMFQWHAPRLKAIEAHFGMRLSRMTMEQQADALDWEMHNVDGVKSAGRRLFGSGHDLHAAVRGALDAELPREYIQNGVHGREYANRYAMSAAALRRISTPTPQVASGNTTQIHMQNVTVKANNPQQLVEQTRKMALTPHDYASSANSGQF
ncbi:phage tail tip lysozyme [Komagataeibacter swingsii]|nr:phage tail tip lysozyme [Komagataeibacter swingsii]GBQ58705.1 hypothetical protein AA16373_1343 [Komagataeibacter swingsii DSM 16373]